MACLRFSQSQLQSCRNASPGLSTIYLANKSDLLGFSLNAAGDTITGITMSGTTKFYTLVLNKQVGSIVDTGTINIQNGTGICKPKISGKLTGLGGTQMSMFNSLLQATVCGAVKTIDLRYFAIGWNNGLDATKLTYGTESWADGFAGIDFELEGLESATFYEISSALNFATAFAI